MKKLLVLMCGLMLLAVASVRAQETAAPLILWIRGDLYRVDAAAAPTALTSSGTISGPALSPDMRSIAYKAASPVGLDALNRVEADGFIANLDLPADIYLLDTASGGSALIAGQPDDASLLVEGVPDKAVVRSTPVWSPDGTQIAWTEFEYPDGQPQIAVYDLASGATSTLAANVPAPTVQGAAPALKWGGGGIAVNASTDAAGEQDFLIYGRDGTLLSSPRLAAVEGDPVTDFVWLEGASQLGILYQSARWIVIDPATGVAQAANSLPRLTTAQAGSRALTFGSDPDEGFFWEIVGETAAAPGSPAQVTLSPDGQQIAFIGFPSSGAVSIWTQGETTTIPNTGSHLDELQVGALLWGYTYWTAA